jgi:predicted NBD/HSP70 family sugar kinase
MGIGGVLDRATGVTLFWPKTLWNNVHVKDFLKENFQTDNIEVDDVTRSMALAERRLGKAQEANEFVYISLGAGIGAALYLGGRLYTGKGAFAGEFGHMNMIADEKGPLCGCGSRGCMEALASATSIIRQAEAAVASGLTAQLPLITQQNPQKITMEAIAQAAEADDRFCLRLLSDAGLYLGIGITNLINLLNPELVILGGRLAETAGKWLLPSITRTIQERAMRGPASQARIELSELGEIDWARGASLMAAENAIRNALLACGHE